MARHTKGRSRSERRRATLVRAGLIPPGDPTGRSSTIAGMIVRRGKSLEIEPLFQPGPPLPVERGPVKPQPGDLVLFTFSYGFKGQIVRLLGKSGVLMDVMEALLADSGIRRGFSQAVLAEAARVAPLHEVSDPDRVDLRDLYTFTVDPGDGPGLRRRALVRKNGRWRHHGLRAHRRRVLLRRTRIPPSIGRLSGAGTPCTSPPAWSRCSRPCCLRESVLSAPVRTARQ